jgi:hypothetical protein
MGNRLSPSSRVYPSGIPPSPRRVTAKWSDTSVLPQTSPIPVSTHDSGCWGGIEDMLSAIFSDMNEELPKTHTSRKTRKLQSSGMSGILTARKVEPLKTVGVVLI